MAKIVVITHEFDHLFDRRFFRKPTSRYFIHGVLRELERRGHSWVVAKGVEIRPEGDVALLHVDATKVPEDYLAFARTYPACMNLGAADISKHHFSTAVVKRDDRWSGPVIIKSVLNHGGAPERRLNRRARRAGRPDPFPGTICLEDYKIYERPSEVPANLFDDPAILVERFLPEREPDGYAIRHWIFLGSFEASARCISSSEIIRGSDIRGHNPTNIPEELRARRQELGLDYGKLDFVVHDDRVHLLDANKTVGSAPPTEDYQSTYEGMADGFEAWLKRYT